MKKRFKNQNMSIYGLVDVWLEWPKGLLINPKEIFIVKTLKNLGDSSYRRLNKKMEI